MQNNHRWHVLETAEQVAQPACQHILEIARHAIAEQGKFKLVLAGGSTPEKVYHLLAQTNADWQRWYIYFGDERCLPVDHKDRNSVMAAQSFLEKVAIPASQIFTMPAELGPEQAAKSYQQTIAGALPFHLVLLGIGEDGHTASLFPGHKHPEQELVHAVYNAPKPPPERVSLSAKALSSTDRLIFLITGASKQEAVKNWRLGQDLPVAAVTAQNPGDIYIDRAAYNA
ncbi:6-phosphogluconolactonase [Candidatus Methylobacter favarea]|uniref:6-phosphogluconolactonase n=1 Tax=Candidatus Methylobacter favarea TaxID=2707345 RepID=A0A8S0WSG2_9GAMM|nr:6-phosphogluconolactonase [Candidatus Methylobacter favarea]CAA9892731.1 6-phosphogluconolactonase [Candidatus Methylobacter favarea]